MQSPSARSTVRKRSEPQELMLSVERDGQCAVARSISGDDAEIVKRTLAVRLKLKARRSDLFTSPTLAATLQDAFRNAIREAQNRHERG